MPTPSEERVQQIVRPETVPPFRSTTKTPFGSFAQDLTDWAVEPGARFLVLTVTLKVRPAAVRVGTLTQTFRLGSAWKEASTEWASLIVTWQVPVPEQPEPVQPAKVDPVAGAAVRVTFSPLVNVAWQVAPQSIPEGEEETVPEPLPDFVTDRSKVGAWGVTGAEGLDAGPAPNSFTAATVNV